MNVELLLIKGAISELPQAEQDKVTVAADALRAVLKQHPEGGFLAFALVAAGLQDEAEQTEAIALKAIEGTKSLCRSCSREIQYNGSYWYHLEGNPRHVANPKS